MFMQKDYSRNYYLKNRERILERNRIYSRGYRRSRDPEKARIYQRKWFEKNIEWVKEYRKIYARKNKELIALRRRTPINRFNVARSCAKKLGREWAIPFNEFKEYILMKCHYCECVLESCGSGLDRKDSLRGYTISNVVPCCRKCNLMKANRLTYDEMVVAMNAIKGLRLKKALGETNGVYIFKSRE